ncbi:site-specific DNA-methyltransferase [Clostridium sp. CS001]|uniref:site-specific DNA-methyltransferase n=1 Tax=Clostridium sp. CS001 TaxID=2880648 RepID=UPI001CF36BC3|nr:site-specific DNA-methyltransferase [Clostridium sp. CS001]MCB2289753.1 site-specific DNA-methyltransferase [Clostridium sp. CS001]
MNFEEMSKEEIIKELLRLRGDNKYGILWEAKPEKVDELLNDYYPVLTNLQEKDIVYADINNANLLIEGDNLHSLYLLNTTHENSIDCILIDPPYNTGNKDFCYNDQYVDKEDSWRHSKWLSFMYRRLTLARDLLTRDGVIFIHIDENEFAQLKLLCDEIFRQENHLGAFIWKSRSGKGGTNSKIATEHEYIYCYAKNIDEVNFKSILNVGKSRKEQLKQWGQEVRREDRTYMFFPLLYKEDEDIRTTIPLEEYSKLYDRTTETFDDEYLMHLKEKYEKEGYIFVLPILDNGGYGRWRAGRNTIIDLLENKEIIFEKVGDVYKAYRLFEEGDVTEVAFGSLLLDKGTASTGTKELKMIFGDKIFDTTKPIAITEFLLDLAMFNKNEGTVLDFFAGSGTTGQAVLQYNQKNNKNLKFILCTNDDMKERTRNKLLQQGFTEETEEYKAEGVCRKVTYPKIKAIIEGYKCEGTIKTVIGSKKLTITNLKNNMPSIFETMDLTKEQKGSEYDEFKYVISNELLNLIGIKNISYDVTGIKSNLKYFITDKIAKNKNRDQMMVLMAQKIYDLLTIKENCFEIIEESPYYRIYKQGDKIMGVYTFFLDTYINDFKISLKRYAEKTKVIYSFSFLDDVDSEAFQDIEGCSVKAIPSKILEIMDELNRRRS